MADGGGSLVNKKLGRLVDPTMGLYFVVLLVFAAASFLLNQPMLAAAEVGAAAALFLFYRLRKITAARSWLHISSRLRIPWRLLPKGKSRYPWP